MNRVRDYVPFENVKLVLTRFYQLVVLINTTYVQMYQHTKMCVDNVSHLFPSY
jgi:hypothetical protein